MTAIDAVLEEIRESPNLPSYVNELTETLRREEKARRRFREIARVSGLINQGFPGQTKSARQLQASSSLFYEVFRKYDGQNMLLSQAES